jgi:pimeloyl-ACP methyl ester carboxylesterase
MRGSRFIQVDRETRLRVEEFEDVASTNRAIILISGAGAPAVYWPDSFCGRLSSHGFNVVRFDHRDTGFSTHFDEQYSIEALIDDTKKVVSAIDADECHLIGHSMGGYIVVMMLTNLDDDRIKTGVAVSAGPTSDRTRYEELGMSEVSPEVWAGLEGAPLTGDLANDLPTWLTTWRFMNGHRDLDVDLATNYTRALHVGDVRNRQVAVNHIHAMTTVPSDLPERLASITRRLVVIHGSEDKLVPSDNGEALASLTPTAELHILDRAGHMFFSEELWIEIENIVLNAINGTKKLIREQSMENSDGY